MGFLSRLFGERKPRIVPVSLNDVNFNQEVLQHKGPCLVDIWSYGCPYCIKLAPTMVVLANKYQGRVKVCELNGGKFPVLAQRMGVQSTPTVVVFENGKLLGRIVGLRPRSYYEEMIETEFPVEKKGEYP